MNYGWVVMVMGSTYITLKRVASQLSNMRSPEIPHFPNFIYCMFEDNRQMYI